MAKRRNLNKYSDIFSRCIAEKRAREEAEKAREAKKTGGESPAEEAKTSG